jgi:HEAT repeat protein
MAVAVLLRAQRDSSGQEARTDWAAELSDERTWMRRRAACALAKIPGLARRVAGPLAGALRDRDPQTRRWAARALARAGAAGRGALQAALSDPIDSVRRLAAEALADQLDQGFGLPERS